MKHTITLGDYLSEAQLRTLVKDYQVEQKYGAKTPYCVNTGSRTPRSRQSEELSGVAAVRARVQGYRHARQRGELKVRPYVSQADAIARYERSGEARARLESREQMFAIGQGQATRKKSDIRANAIAGGRRGGRIVHRPTIDEGKSAPIRMRSKRPVVGVRV